MSVRATWIGTATVLVEVSGVTVLTDPAFDPPGTPHHFVVPGSAMRIPLRRTVGPAVAVEQLPPIDVVLLSHDEHADNLDTSGRRLLDSARLVITTPSAARRIGPPAIGLAPWESRVVRCGGIRLRVTATPARHAPEAWAGLAGEVIGFVLEVVDDRTPREPVLYFSGDTVPHPQLDEVGRRFAVDTAFLHLGAARFAASGDTPYSLDAEEAVALARSLRARAVVPVHVDDWDHFTLTSDAVRAAFAAAGLSHVLRPLTPGVRTELGGAA
ncbi:L-ascorbate metabolism protein UlaG, beta-lactamase superfamily [Blastococcus aurantiacus]|uniref:L-ascorbate metabolism protein UlaG, beta-lactamase superfamily n=1 Tax=Blastococcus aurantiacus TaxID=1550231 RepID=A0A1G7HC83_9ACTN|nr:MBL fold metallo-hydrolase [Blastococcus aurantiacus]SDE98062.1 L-ascorbate metabolism protein UlaG, beta-lactamase superfamily [Blastococcus aurantiacus]